MEVIDELIEKSERYLRELPPPPPSINLPRGREIAAWIDHTLLKPDATAGQIKALCEQARQHHFASVCINPAFVHLAAGLLIGSGVPVCTVIGFPLGATLSTVKVVETLACINAGATEVDMVLNIGAIKGEAYGQALNDIRAVGQVAHSQRAIVKVILEMALLTRAEKILACLICQAAGADFVKTSTGFSSGGATVEDVQLMRRVVGAGMGVKAAGGIRTYADAIAMIQAGATRIGTSAGVHILEEAIG